MKLTARQLAALMQVRRQPQSRQTHPTNSQQQTSELRIYIKQIRKVT